MATDPDSLSDPKQIRTLLENARREGKAELIFRRQVRLAKLEGARYVTSLEREFWAPIAAAEELASAKNGKKPRLTRTRQKVDRVGIRRWGFHKGTTQGFDILVRGGHPELTGKAGVCSACGFP